MYYCSMSQYIIPIWCWKSFIGSCIRQTNTILKVLNGNTRLITCSGYKHSQNIWNYLYFSREIAHYRKSLISVFQKLFASLKKNFILAGRLKTRLLFYKVLRLSWYFLIKTLKSFGNSWGNSHIPYLQVIIAHRFSCG